MLNLFKPLRFFCPWILTTQDWVIIHYIPPYYKVLYFATRYFLCGVVGQLVISTADGIGSVFLLILVWLFSLLILVLRFSLRETIFWRCKVLGFSFGWLCHICGGKEVMSYDAICLVGKEVMSYDAKSVVGKEVMSYDAKSVGGKEVMTPYLWWEKRLWCYMK